MRAVAERDVRVRIARDVEYVRTSEHALVPVPRRVHQQHLIARWDRAPAHFDVLRRRARHVDHRRDPPQEFLYGPGDRRRIVEQHLPLPAIAEDRFQSSGDRVARRFVATDQQEQ